MGVVNVTPDSFFAPSRAEGAAAVARGRDLVEAGAAVLDVGGESTRPGRDAGPRGRRARPGGARGRRALPGARGSRSTPSSLPSRAPRSTRAPPC